MLQACTTGSWQKKQFFHRCRRVHSTPWIPGNTCDGSNLLTEVLATTLTRLRDLVFEFVNSDQYLEQAVPVSICRLPEFGDRIRCHPVPLLHVKSLGVMPVWTREGGKRKWSPLLLAALQSRLTGGDACKNKNTHQQFSKYFITSKQSSVNTGNQNNPSKKCHLWARLGCSKRISSGVQIGTSEVRAIHMKILNRLLVDKQNAVQQFRTNQSHQPRALHTSIGSEQPQIQCPNSTGF